MRLRLTLGARLFKGLACRSQAVAQGARFGVLALKSQLRVAIDTLVYRGLQQERRGRAQVQPPAQLDHVVQPLFFRSRADDDLVAGHFSQALVERTVHAVFDGHDIGQLSDAGAQLGAHDIAAIGVVPQGNADVQLLAEVAVVLVNGLVGVRAEMQNRAVHHDVVGANILRVARQRQHDVQVGV